MSGILGHIGALGQPVDPGRFKRMLDAMCLRGPDAEGIWHDQHVGLGHRMLRTTPEAHLEELPWHDKESQCVITSDARLDNRPELIEALGKNSFKMEVIPDSVIILQAYLKWGADCVHRLLGDFSFAIWDIKKQALFCARDFLGVKPFNYCFKDGIFLFCSEPRVIARYSGLSFNINESRIADSLTPNLEGYDTISTFYKEIFRLPPAHTLESHDDHIRINRYWNPESNKTSVCKTDDEYREALTEILKHSVADRCRGEKYPAILQSGGVDSAAVMGVAREYCREVSGGMVQTYSGVSEDIVDCKESRLISFLSGSGDINPHLYTPEDLCKSIDSVFGLVSQLGEPFDIIMNVHFFLYSQAAKGGAKFMLDGVDGDLATSLPYSYPARLFRQFSFRAAKHETFLQCKDFLEGVISPYRYIAKYSLSAFCPEIIKYCRWRMRLPRIVEGYLDESVVRRSFARQVSMGERLLEFERTNRKSNLSFPYEVYQKRVQHVFLTVALERYNRVASLCSIEPRHPLLDKRLIDFYMGLPWNQFMRDGWSKFLLRRVAEQFVPPKICWRTGKEHVGWKFTKKMLQLKEDIILEQINLQYDTLKDIVKYEFLNSLSKKAFDKTQSKQTAIKSDVAGLTLWLKNT